MSSEKYILLVFSILPRKKILLEHDVTHFPKALTVNFPNFLAPSKKKKLQAPVNFKNKI